MMVTASTRRSRSGGAVVPCAGLVAGAVAAAALAPPAVASFALTGGTITARADDTVGPVVSMLDPTAAVFPSVGSAMVVDGPLSAEVAHEYELVGTTRELEMTFRVDSAEVADGFAEVDLDLSFVVSQQTEYEISGSTQWFGGFAFGDVEIVLRDQASGDALYHNTRGPNGNARTIGLAQPGDAGTLAPGAYQLIARVRAWRNLSTTQSIAEGEFTFRFGSPLSPPCTADLTDDQRVDVFDLLVYLDLWFAGDDAAERTGNSPAWIDIFDLLAYLDDWFAGC